jgi:hypothetical protein
MEGQGGFSAKWFELAETEDHSESLNTAPFFVTYPGFVVQAELHE